MGENEEGGMLRVVVVVGLIAMIAGFVIFAITGMKNTMNSHTDTAVGTVVRTRADQPYKQANVKWDSYKPPAPGSAYLPGKVYSVEVPSRVPHNYWLDTAVRLKFNTDLDLRVDINNFNVTAPGGSNDQDDWVRREMQIYDDSGKLVTQQIGTISDITNKNDRMLDAKGLKGDTWYTVVYRWYNNQSYDIGNVNNEYTRITLNSPTGAPISLEVSSIEMAKYEDKYKIQY